MRILDFFNFRQKKSFKTRQQVDTKNEKNEKLVGLLNVREENTNEMFSNISKYVAVRNELLRKGILEQDRIDDEEGTLIINDFLENVIEQLPAGIIIPIKTSFVYKGKEQTLFIGNNLMTVGKSLKPNGSRPRHGIKTKAAVAFFIDSNEELDVFNQTKNTRITLSEEVRPKIMNLVKEHVIDSKTVNCRISNVEISFKNWERSLECVTTPKESGVVGEIIDHLTSLDYEITTGITKYLHNETEKMELENKQTLKNEENTNTTEVSDMQNDKTNNESVDN